MTVADALPRVLLALAAVILVGRLLGALCSRLGQPAVLGEVIGGILLGPSLIGRSASEWLLPPAVAPFLGVIAQLGVVLYMFLVGLELNASHLRRRAGTVFAVAHVGIGVPFVIGVVLAYWLHNDFAPAGVPLATFALFLGSALSVTAFPVLARILGDRRMAHSDIGILALGCAAAGDASAWCLLAVVVGVARSQVGGAFVTAGLTVGFVAVMLFAAHPMIDRYARRAAIGPTAVAAILVGVLLSAWTAELVGVHAIFGAFLMGAIIPHNSELAHAVARKLEDAAKVLLLPAFFAYTGMRTEIGLVSDSAGWLCVIAITAAATIGKVGGTWAAARFCRLDGRTAVSLGVLMNTRGLMELIVLNVGLDLGVITPALFAAMVLMALTTTLTTGPALNLIDRYYARQVEKRGDMIHTRAAHT
ncbi:MAG: cation:proton antiporter [Gemmataceae bacterium]